MTFLGLLDTLIRRAGGRRSVARELALTDKAVGHWATGARSISITAAAHILALAGASDAERLALWDLARAAHGASDDSRNPGAATLCSQEAA